MLPSAAWHSTEDSPTGEQRLYLAIIAQAVQDAIYPLNKARVNPTVHDVMAARLFFVNGEQFAELVGIVEAAGLPIAAAYAVRAWALDLDARGWLLTPQEAERLVYGNARKGPRRCVNSGMGPYGSLAPSM